MSDRQGELELTSVSLSRPARSQAVKGSARIYLEAYTSILMVDKDKLEAFYGKEVILSTREMVETESDEILRDADKVDVSFLVVGDPFG